MTTSANPRLWIVLLILAILILTPLLLVALGILAIAPVRIERGYGPNPEPIVVPVQGPGLPGSGPLPHSPKGYELYSWFDTDASTWTFSLITGTDRLKAFAELRDPQIAVSPDGWVTITVPGVRALKAALRLLPRGQQVTWIGNGWLEQAGAEADLVQAIRPPGEALIAEMVAYCGQLGVVLVVSGPPDA